MKISVIIPIYKVEAYIGRCVRSLMEQGMSDVEYIFVDDCSPDGSIDIVERVVTEYPQAQEQVKILRHSENRGLPAARNTGLQAASGEYIFHCDSDDYLAPGALQMMYDEARQHDADIVYSDWMLTFPKKERYMPQPACATPDEALHQMLHGRMKWNVWNKLVRRTLYTDNDIHFPDGHGMGEDMTMIMLFACARNISYLPGATYHYVRQNEHAFTASPSEQSYEDLHFNANSIISFLQGRVSDEDLACFKLNVKFPFLISGRRRDYERWNEWFPEANRYIMSNQVSMRARLLQKAASKRWYLVLKAYYYGFHSIVYGLFY